MGRFDWRLQEVSPQEDGVYRRCVRHWLSAKAGGSDVSDAETLCNGVQKDRRLEAGGCQLLAAWRLGGKAGIERTDVQSMHSKGTRIEAF